MCQIANILTHPAAMSIQNRGETVASQGRSRQPNLIGGIACLQQME
jgi:hypothetical protein